MEEKTEEIGKREQETSCPKCGFQRQEGATECPNCDGDLTGFDSTDSSEQTATNIVRGKPIEVIDLLGNVLSLPQKILLLSYKIDKHIISEKVEKVVEEFLYQHQLNDVKVRLNQYAPHQEFKRLFRTKNIHFVIRIPLGLFQWLIYLLMPNRIIGGDFYNPYTNTANIFSDHVAIALHELGHALDFKRRKYPGLYQLARFIPLFALYQEFIASKYAIQFLMKRGYLYEEKSACKILYPAYATYVFGGIYDLIPSPIFAVLYLPFIGLGHLLGRMHAAIVVPSPHPEPPKTFTEKISESINKVRSFFHEKKNKILIAKLLSILGGLILGRIVWGWWGGLIVAVLMYYASVEIIKYRGKETNSPEEEITVSPSQRIEEVIAQKKKIVEYGKIIQQYKEVFGQSLSLRYIERVRSLESLAKEIETHLENKDTEWAELKSKDLKHQLYSDKRTKEIREFYAIFNEFHLGNLYESKRHRELLRIGNKIRNQSDQNPLIKQFFKETRRVLAITERIYGKAKIDLSDHEARRALALSQAALQLVPDDKKIANLHEMSKCQVEKAGRALQKADLLLAKNHYSRAMRSARKACKLDSTLEDRANAVIESAEVERKRKRIRRILIAGYTTAVICAAAYPVKVSYEYLVTKTEFDEIMQSPIIDRNIKNKIADLKGFAAKHSSTKFKEKALKEIKRLSERQESYEFTNLETKVSKLEALHEFKRAIELIESFLLVHPNVDKRKIIDDQIERLREKDDYKDYTHITKLAQGIKSEQALNTLQSLYAKYKIDHPQGKFRAEIEKKTDQAEELFIRSEYLHLVAHHYEKQSERLAAYRAFVTRRSSSKWAKRITGLLAEDIRKYYANTKAKLDFFKRKRQFIEAMAYCNEFISNVKYGEFVDLMAKEKEELELRKKDLDEFEKMAEAEENLGENYQEEKKIYSEYLEANPRSYEAGKIGQRIKKLDEKISQKSHLKKIVERIKNKSTKTALGINLLENYLRKRPLEPFRSRADSLLSQLKNHQVQEIKREKAERKNKVRIAEGKQWQKTFNFVIKDSTRYSDKVRMLKNYMRTYRDNSKHLAEAKEIIESIQIQLREEKRIESGLKASGRRFVLNGDGTATDTETGLMWVVVDSLANLGGGDLTFRAARNYVSRLRVGGYADWRLPSPEELASLYKKKPCFPVSNVKWYWTSHNSLPYNSVEVITTDYEKVRRVARIEKDKYGSVRAVRSSASIHFVSGK